MSYREAQEKLDVQSPGVYCQDYKEWTRNEMLTPCTTSFPLLTYRCKAESYWLLVEIDITGKFAGEIL